MSYNNNGGPAFPRTVIVNDGIDDYAVKFQNGMSLRDWFAGQALCGLLLRHGDEHPCSGVTGDAYEYADAMLKAREAGKEQQ